MFGVREDGTAFTVNREGVNLFLFIGERGLGRHIDQQLVALPQLLQGDERGFAAFDAAFAGVNDLAFRRCQV